MSENKKYNGYTNRETWLVSLWIANDKELHAHWNQKTKERVLAAKTRTEEARALSWEIEEWCHEQRPSLSSGLFCDLLSAAIGRVDWFEVAWTLWIDCEAELSEPVLIHAYSRAQAIADGVLVDVTGLAKEAGFKIPVALTSAAWADCVAVPHDAVDQDETGRLWDVLTVLRIASRESLKNRSSSEIRFTVSVRTGEVTSEYIELKSICGPGDSAEPVITIMLPHED